MADMNDLPPGFSPVAAAPTGAPTDLPPGFRPFGTPESQPRVAQNIADSLTAAWQSSATGLMARGKLPEVSIGAETPWYDRAAATVAGLAADSPEMAVGAAVGSTVAPGIGTMAGMFAVPMAIRNSLMQAYSQGGVHTWTDAWNVIKEGAVGGAKGAVLGAATGGAGKLAGIAGDALAPVVGKAAPFVTGALKAGAESSTLAVGGAALEGRVANSQDFLDAAIVVGGLHAAGAVAGRLRNIYAKTGVDPADVALAAQRDPALKTAINTSDEIPPQLKPLADAETAKAAAPDPTPGAQPTPDPHELRLDIPPEGVSPSAVDTRAINSPEDIDLATNRLSQIYDERVQEQGRWVVSRAESMAKGQQLLADALGSTPEGEIPMPHAVGAAENDSQIWSRVELVRDTASRTKTAALAVANAKPEDLTPQQLSDFLTQVERTGMIGSHFMGGRAEAGRALQMLRNTTGLADQFEIMQSAIKEYGNTKDIQALARAFAESDSTASTVAAARSKAKTMTTGEKIMQGLVQVRNAMLLSGLKTYQAKAVGDAVITSTELASRWLAVGMGKLHPGSGVTTAEALAYTTGLARAIPDALKVGADAFKNPEAYRPAFEHKDVIQGKVLGEIFGGIQHRVMGSETEAFRTLNARAELAGRAVRSALDEKLTPGTDDFNGRVSDLIANPSADLAAASKLAGDRATYTENLGRIGQVVQAASRVPILNLTMIPFARVPANLFKTAVRYTPGVGMLLDDVQKDFAAGGAQRDLAIARQVIGAGVMYGVMKAVEGGTMTGGFLSMTPAEREAALAEGKQPYSFKIGDKHFSYSRLEYASHIAGLAADLTEIGARASKDDKANVWLLSAAILGHSMISSTYMAGMNELMQAIGDPARAAKRWGYQFAGSFEPALTAQVATANDPYKRRVDTLTDELKSRLPYFRDQLLPQLNSGTGEPVPNNKNMTIFDVSTQSHDPVLSEAERLGVNLGKAPKTVSIGRGLGKLGKIDITPEQQNAYTQVGGQFSHELLTSLVTGPEWKDVPLPVKVKMFERAIEAGRRRAAAETLPPEAREVEVNKAVGELYKEFDKR